MVEQLGHEQAVAGKDQAAKLFDKNHDGQLTASDIPFPPGSIEAKKAWMQIDQQAHSPEMVAKAKKMGYENATGMYNGKPLVPGVNKGDGDAEFFKDKLVMHNGLSPESAQKIVQQAAKEAANKPAR